jgi:hypothetical protein
MGGGVHRKFKIEKSNCKIYDRIISLENLFLAWREFWRGKRNKPDVQEFEFNLEDNLFQLHQELKAKTYQRSHYTPFYIQDPKLRRIHIKNKIQDDDAIWFIEKIIKSFKKENDNGLPLGNVTSQLFANIYLNELDQFAKHKLRVRHYLRHCDDFVILGESKEYLTGLIYPINAFLKEKLKLNIHPDKIIIRKHNQGIDFLGYVVLPHYRILRTKTKRRILKRIKNKRPNLQSLQSYFGVLKHCRGHKIRKKIIDLIFKNDAEKS